MQLGLGSLPQQCCGRATLRRQALRVPAVPSSVRVPAQRPRQHAARLRALGGEGAGAAPGSSQSKPSAGAAGSPPATPDAVIKSARETQLSASELLVRALCFGSAPVTGSAVDNAVAQAEFLQAEDLQDAVAKRVSLLDEAFFTTASTYISLARRDGQPLVENALTEVLRVAAAAKDATLRPEIRLLNALMRATTPAERELLYQQQASTLTRYGSRAALCVRLCAQAACPHALRHASQRQRLLLHPTCANDFRRGAAGCERSGE